MHTAELFKNSIYLGKIKTKFKNTYASLSGAQMGSNHKKIGGQKSRDTLPLSTVLILKC